MKQDLTQIAIVLDRSGSMADVRQPTIDGFNEFVNGQKAIPGDANLTLIQFDTENSYEVVFDNKPIKETPQLTNETFVPRGGTPLHDAIGRTITELGTKLSNTPESERPAKVVVVIMTDGLENSSKEYKREKIADMIKHQREAYQWEFIFLGANQDAILTGQALGVLRAQAVYYNASVFDPTATVDTFKVTSAAIGAFRKGATRSVAYSEEDRKKARGKGKGH